MFNIFSSRHTFIIEMFEHGWSGYQCECVLRKYGISVRDRFVCVGREGDLMPPYLSFSVEKKQAVWAEYILFRSGVPVISETVDERNEQHRATDLRGNRSIPPGGGGGIKKDFTTKLIDFLTPLVGFAVGDYGHDLPVKQRSRHTGQRGVVNGRYRKGK